MRMNYTDGTPALDFTLITPDMILWERYARQNKLPIKRDDSAFPEFTFMAFVSYSAARRLKAIPDSLSFDDYQNKCAMPTRSESEDADDSDPT